MSEHMSLDALMQALAEERGLDLRGYKHSTLERRVRKRMARIGIDSYAEYLAKVRENPGPELSQLLNTVLINVTEFFRDPQAWDFLGNEILPRMLAQLRPGDSFRAWSAGCASGEEAYSIAILVADALGNRLPEFDIKIYGTDIDEDALTTARRGQYSLTALRRLRPEWRERYFTGNGTNVRINPEVRRLVIFGRSNLVSDAPISHCTLVCCRNVLIYFDIESQKQIFSRLHYALEPRGLLFLGKAESKLTESSLFRPISSRWRIFQKKEKVSPRRIPDEGLETVPNDDQDDALQQQLQALQHQYRSLLQTIKSAVLTLDARDVITVCNESALAIWGLANVPLIGKRLQNTDLVYKCPELAARIESSKSGGNDPVAFQCRIRTNEEERVLSLLIRPVISESGVRTGTIVNAEDITTHERLQSTVEQLEATSDELQSANEELETTNEELQSTNEELETTNEELQSTNEELETTNEELQSLNEELENLNEELESRTRELNTLTNRYAETLKRMPWPVMLVDRDEKIQLWNGAAQKVFGIGATSVVGVDLDRMPLEQTLRKALVRRCRGVMQNKKPTTIQGVSYDSIGTAGKFDVRFTPISRENNDVDGVMIMFGPTQGALNGPGVEKPNDRKAPAKAANAKNSKRDPKGNGRPKPRSRT